MSDASGANWRRPACDVYESDSAMEILADVPGAGRHDLKIEIEGDELMFETRGDEGDTEAGPPCFRRRFRIAQNVDREAVRAKLQDGVLQITLPLRAAGMRTIEIEE